MNPAAALRWAGPCLLAVAMAVAAEQVGRPELLFPEGVALAVGLWVLRRADWAMSRWRIVAGPTLCGLAGLLIVRLPGPAWALTLLAVVVALLVLTALRSPLGPAVSAAALPVWFGITDPTYLLLVVILCGVVAVLAPRAGRPAPPSGWGVPVLVTFTCCASIWLAVVGLLGLPPAAAAPPLLVACLEFTVTGAREPGVALRRWALLTAGAVIGCAAAALIGPEWAVAGVAVGAMLVLLWLTGVPHPPAAAIALVPLVIGRPDPVPTAVAITVGAAMVHLLPAVLAPLVTRARVLLRDLPGGLGPTRES